MVKVLFDTNIVIDVLRGVPPAQDVMISYPERAVSIISWMEVMVGAPATLSDATRAFLRGFELIGLTESIANQAVVVRQVHKLKLPDAVIWATAKVHGLKLLTRDTKGFPRQHPDIMFLTSSDGSQAIVRSRHELPTIHVDRLTGDIA